MTGIPTTAPFPPWSSSGSCAIPLVFVTSKTRAEVVRLQEEMGIREPFIVENGGGIFFPRGYRNFCIPGGVERGDQYADPAGEALPRDPAFRRGSEKPAFPFAAPGI